ncbi:MAG: hypothetical protein QOH97_1361 [Actinoplanes sp.]|jgi:hypothetical protein|nr:hypothetical protein [Actinoplanes sp.]
MTTDDDAFTRDLERILGSPELVRKAKEGISRLRNGVGGDHLAEMARDLLDGRTSIREIGQSSAYAAPLTEQFTKYNEWFNGLKPEERERLISETNETLDRLEDSQDGSNST